MCINNQQTSVDSPRNDRRREAKVGGPKLNNCTNETGPRQRCFSALWGCALCGRILCLGNAREITLHCSNQQKRGTRTQLSIWLAGNTGPKQALLAGKWLISNGGGHWSVSHPSSYLTRRRSKTVKHQQSITWLGTETKLVSLVQLKLYAETFEGQKIEEKLYDSSDACLGCGRMKKIASRGSRTPTDWMETSHSTAKLSTRPQSRYLIVNIYLYSNSLAAVFLANQQ